MWISHPVLLQIGWGKRWPPLNLCAKEACKRREAIVLVVQKCDPSAPPPPEMQHGAFATTRITASRLLDTWSRHKTSGGHLLDLANWLRIGRDIAFFNFWPRRSTSSSSLKSQLFGLFLGFISTFITTTFNAEQHLITPSSGSHDIMQRGGVLEKKTYWAWTSKRRRTPFIASCSYTQKAPRPPLRSVLGQGVASRG